MCYVIFTSIILLQRNFNIWCFFKTGLFFENNYFWFCLEKSLCNPIYNSVFSFTFPDEWEKRKYLKKRFVSFIMAKQVNIEVILLKSLRHLLKKPDTTIWWGRRLPGWQLVFSCSYCFIVDPYHSDPMRLLRLNS